METITYSQVQTLVYNLPVKKLPAAYRLLRDLGGDASESASVQEDFMLLPAEERKSALAEQAEQMKAYYEQTASEREIWQAGEFHAYQAG